VDRDSLISQLRRTGRLDREVPQRAIDRAVAAYRDLMRPARRIAMTRVATPGTWNVRAALSAHDEIRSYEGEGCRLELQLHRDASAVGQLRIEGAEPHAGAAYVVDERGRALTWTTLNAVREFCLECRLPSRFYLVVGGKWLRLDLGELATRGE